LYLRTHLGRSRLNTEEMMISGGDRSTLACSPGGRKYTAIEVHPIGDLHQGPNQGRVETKAPSTSMAVPTKSILLPQSLNSSHGIKRADSRYPKRNVVHMSPN
jgi:hypothetical protein